MTGMADTPVLDTGATGRRVSRPTGAGRPRLRQVAHQARGATAPADRN